MKKFFSLVAAVLFAGSMMAAEVLNVDFTAGQGDWTIDNVLLPEGTDFIWAQDSRYGMKATAYFGDQNHASEAWLISPEFSLEGMTSVTLSFSHARKYGNLQQLSVVVKAGEGIAWAPLQVSAWPDGSSWTFVDATADLTEYAGEPSVQIAFVYTSSDDAAATWEIKTVSVADGGDVPPVEEPDVVFTGADFLGQGTSSTGSPVSATKDGVTFACDKAYSDDSHSTLRCYKNGVITITSETEQIGKLVFQFFESYTGDLETEVVVNAKEWSYTLTNQARIEKLSIYFGEYEPIDPPVIEEITVAQAMEIGEALPSGGYSEKKYTVVGYVASAKDYGDKYEGKQTFYMSDDPAAERGDFTAYNCNVAAPGVVKGDYVKVTGKIQKYAYESGDYTIEITGGDVEIATQGIENIVLTEQAQKVVVDGVIYIVRDNKLFNLQGAQVR